jgi:hypothetical protein
MARPELVDNGLWELLKPLLADRTPQRTEDAPESATGELWRRGVRLIIARRGTEHGSGLGR